IHNSATLKNTTNKQSYIQGTSPEYKSTDKQPKKQPHTYTINYTSLNYIYSAAINAYITQISLRYTTQTTLGFFLKL
ncbi:hypothetical protein, partial [Escherichia coli]|uniref:hypothetical protein n=1 Tax=Escherichia coli TaxID=562 RepID=UPI001BFC6BB1